MFLCIINNQEYTSLIKDNAKQAFSVPGEIFVFEYDYVAYQRDLIQKDPFKFYKSQTTVDNFRVGNFELIDTSLEHRYSNNYRFIFTIYNHTDKSTKKITREGYYDKVFHEKELKYVLSLMIFSGNNKSWQPFDLMLELETLRKEVKYLNGVIKKLEEKE